MSLLLSLGGEYNLRSELFSANEQGAILDPFLSESARTWRRNLLTYSDQFSNAVWTKTNCTITANTTVAPDGTTTADTLTDDATSGLHFIQHSAFSSNTEGNRFCRSFYVKKGTARYIAISPISTFNFAENILIFDFDTGTYTNTGTVNTLYIDGYTTPENVGNGWWRLSFWSDAGSAGYGRVALAMFNGPSHTNGSYSGSGSTVFIWGFQAENGITTPTTYQPITDFSTEFKAAFPTHTIYQDSNGVAPVTAPGDLVGLVLDQRQGALTNLGPELVTNGTFEAGLVGVKADDFGSISTWTINTTNPISGTQDGRLTITTGASGRPSINFSSALPALVSGTRYLISFDYKVLSGTFIFNSILVAGTITTHNFSLAGQGRQTLMLVAGSDTTNKLLFYAGNSVCDVQLDNISVRELRGNHAFQSTSGARPTLGRVPFGGRRNLLTRTEEFDNAAWTKTSTAVTANNAVDHLGELTADLVACNSTGASCRVGQAFTVASGSSYTLSVNVKMATAPCIYLRMEGYDTSPGGYFDIQNGVVGNLSAGLTSAITSLGDGWYRCSISGFSTVTDVIGNVNVYISDAVNSLTVTSGASVYLTKAQLEVGSLTTYQRVTSTHDVTEAGQPDCWYLDTSSSKWMQTNAIDFSATDEMTVIAGVRKLSDAASATLLESGTDASSVNGSFAVYAPRAVNNAVEYRSRGTAAVTVTEGNVSPAPTTLVFTGISDISSDSVVVRKNAIVANTSSSDQGSGNYSNQILYLFSRAGASLFLNGHLFHLIIRGKTTEGSKLTGAERLTARKAGITI